MTPEEKDFEVYKLAVEMADRVSSRRMVANGFFLTIHTAIVAILGFGYEKSNHPVVIVVSGLTGLLLALTWFFSIRSYRRLNRAKFDVINLMESAFPTPYFTREWEQLTRTTNDDAAITGLRARWLEIKDRYTTLTNIESFVPAAFGLIYLAAIVGAITGVAI